MAFPSPNCKSLPVSCCAFETAVNAGVTAIPRNGAGIYTLPSVYLAETGELIVADQHNDPLEDIKDDLNAARPVVAGGTGSTTASGARTALSVYSQAESNAAYVKRVSSKTALKALDTALYKVAFLEGNPQKLFTYTLGDFTDEVLTDPAEEIYIPADGISVAIGLWVAVTGNGLSVQPILAGGTGATTADAALTNLGGGTAGKAIFADATVADVRTYISAAPYVASLAALKALDTTKDTVARFDGDHWDFISGNYSTQVTADTVGAIFAKADAIATTSGAWARRGGYYAMGRAELDWFNVPSDGTAAASALNTAMTICAALGITRIKGAEKAIYALLDLTVPAGSFDIDWNNSKLQGTYTTGVGSLNVATATSGSSTTDFIMSNFILDGGWDSSDTTATDCEKILAIKGYRRCELNNFDMIDVATGTAAETTAIFGHVRIGIDIWNCQETYLRPRTIKNNRRIECIVIKSDDATHVATVEGGLFLDGVTAGSPVNFLNLGHVSWRDSIISGWPAGPNVLVKTGHIQGIRLHSITDNGLDTCEALFYTSGLIIEDCIFTDIGNANGERALYISGVTTVRNCHFDNCYLPICAETVLAANALESGAGLGDAPYGPWAAQTEKPINVTLENNTFNGVLDTVTSTNIRVFGTLSNLATATIRGADRAATTTNAPKASIWGRYIDRMDVTGTFYDGTDEIIHHGHGDGTYYLNADFHPIAGAHVFHLNRDSAVTTNATVHWKEAKRFGSLSASHYDIANGTSNGYNAIYADGPNQPTTDTGIASTIPIVRNGVWYRVISTDAAFTITSAAYEQRIKHTGTLTADRAVTITDTNAIAGASRIFITRTGGGAFNLNVGTGPLKAMATGSWGIFDYDGSARYLATP